ncbi:MAG TPA: IPT/TIG domain-containing protein [Terriglobales bacterium]|nr:IPT/TIG domain-containing protein [Terriglobales bacterium]
MKTICVLLLTIFAIGCGNYHAPMSTTSGAGAAQISALVPNSATAGGPQFMLTINGNGFATNSVVYFNGALQNTMFVSGKQLVATIPATDIATSGTKPVYVLTVGGIYNSSNQTSNTVNFMVN